MTTETPEAEAPVKAAHAVIFIEDQQYDDETNDRVIHLTGEKLNAMYPKREFHRLRSTLKSAGTKALWLHNPEVDDQPEGTHLARIKNVWNAVQDIRNWPDDCYAKSDETPRAPLQMEDDLSTIAPDHGVLRQGLDLYSPTTESADAFIMASLLTAFASVVGPKLRLKVGSSSHPLNNYLLIVGQSTRSRKSTALRMARRHIQKASKGGLLGYGISPEATEHFLRYQHNITLIVPEYKSMIEQASKSFGTGSLETYTDLHDGELQPRVNKGATDVRRSQAKGGEPEEEYQKRVEQAVLSALGNAEPVEIGLSILAASTMPWLSKLSIEDIQSGMMARFLLVFGASKARMSSPPIVDANAQRALDDSLKRFQDLEGIVTKSPAAEAAHAEWYDAWCERLENAADEGTMFPIFARWEVIAQKLAALRDLSMITDDRELQHGMHLQISEESMRAAMRVIDGSLRVLTDQLEAGLFGSNENQHLTAIVSIIETLGEATERDLLRHAPTTMTASTLRNLLGVLMRSGEINEWRERTDMPRPDEQLRRVYRIRRK